MAEHFDRIVRAVQHNCDIADAQHGGEYSMCVYLLKMREYFRWERGLAFGEKLPNRDVGDWMMSREALWEGLSKASFEPIVVDDESYDPFDSEAINEALSPYRLVYSGGLGHNARPHFFLADLYRRERPGRFEILVADREYARDLTAPPAMTQGHRIFVRRESLRRMIWEKLETWRWSRPDSALGKALAAYDFDNDLDRALESMADDEMENVLLHETGEARAGELLGDRWNHMLLSLRHSKAEIMARAVRDHLADCLTTLPALLEGGRSGALYFFIGNLSYMRREIFPGLLEAYDAWVSSGRLDGFARNVEQGKSHWLEVAREMMELHRRHGDACAQSIEPLMERSRL